MSGSSPVALDHRHRGGDRSQGVGVDRRQEAAEVLKRKTDSCIHIREVTVDEPMAMPQARLGMSREVLGISVPITPGGLGR